MAHVVLERRRRCLVSIEAALVFPLLLLLTLGLMELGWMILKSHQIANAARNGARIGVRIDATNADVQQAVDSLMAAAGMADSGYAVTLVPADVSQMNGGEQLTVTLTVLYENIDLGMPLVPTPTALEASVTMAKEGF